MKPNKEREAMVEMALNVPAEVDIDFQYPEEKHQNSFHKLLADIEENTHLNNQERQELIELVRECEGSFSDTPGMTTLIEHDIELISNDPIRSKQCRWSPRQKEILESEITRTLELGLIVEADSEYTSPIFLVEAPGKKHRPCIDYRQLNAVTRDQTYPIPNLEERIETMSRAKYISTLDLTRCYRQVPLSERASRYAAFISPLGTFRP